MSVSKDTVIEYIMERVGHAGSGLSGDFEWTEKLVNEHMDKFIQELEWHVFDAVWDTLAKAATDIEVSA